MDDLGEYHNDSFEPEPMNLYHAIKIQNVSKIFGKNIAVKNCYLNICQDQITVLLGHNGSGKTTLLSMLTGMVNPTNGTIFVDNYDLKTNIPKVRRCLGFCPQNNILFEDLTIHEHLYFFSKLKGVQDNEMENEIDKYLNCLDMDAKVICLLKNLVFKHFSNTNTYVIRMLVLKMGVIFRRTPGPQNFQEG